MVNRLPDTNASLETTPVPGNVIKVREENILLVSDRKDL